MNGCIQLKMNFTILLLPEKGYISVSFTMKKITILLFLLLPALR